MRANPSPLTEINVEMHSISTGTGTTGGYRDRHAGDSDERDFEIPGFGDYCEDMVSDITAISRAVDQGPPREPICRPRRAMLLPCLVFVVCLLAVVLANAKGRGSGGGVISPKATVYGAKDDADDGEPEQSTQGRVVEFTVANLNTNANNCTHDKSTKVLQCIPAHNPATNKFRILLHPDWAPIGVERFEDLTTSSFWDNVRIFRIVPDFVSQFGIR